MIMADEGIYREAGRHNPAQGVHILPGRSAIVLLTVTTEGRMPWLAAKLAHELLHKTWEEARAWLVGEYVLMPDHLHMFCAPHDLSVSIEVWIKYWKREFSLRHQNQSWRFQSRGWHHRIRQGESHSEKWTYMQENPVRKGLVKNAE